MEPLPTNERKNNLSHSVIFGRHVWCIPTNEYENSGAAPQTARLHTNPILL